MPGEQLLAAVAWCLLHSRRAQRCSCSLAQAPACNSPFQTPPAAVQSATSYDYKRQRLRLSHSSGRCNSTGVTAGYGSTPAACVQCCLPRRSSAAQGLPQRHDAHALPSGETRPSSLHSLYISIGIGMASSSSSSSSSI